MQSWILLFTALSMNSLANILIKIGARPTGLEGLDHTLLKKVVSFLNLSTILAMFFFACNVFIYRKALEDIPLSVAYPIMAGGGLFVVTLVSFLHPLMREKICFLHILGLILILAGIILVTREM